MALLKLRINIKVKRVNMMSAQQPGVDYNNQNMGGAGFAAHPKVVSQKPKFKDPYGRNAE